jgi:hypothetical protein
MFKISCSKYLLQSSKHYRQLFNVSSQVFHTFTQFAFQNLTRQMQFVCFFSQFFLSFNLITLSQSEFPFIYLLVSYWKPLHRVVIGSKSKNEFSLHVYETRWMEEKWKIRFPQISIIHKRKETHFSVDSLKSHSLARSR